MLEMFSIALITKLSATLVATFISAFVAKKTIGYLEKSRITNEWIKTLLLAIHGPSAWIIIAYGLISAGIIVLIHFSLSTTILIKLQALFLVTAATILSFRWKSRIETLLKKRLIRKSKIKSDQILFSAIGKIASIAIIAFAGVMVLDILGVPLKALLAFGGISGIAVSWAAKDIVANFFGGFMLYINRPFVIDDWIYSPNKNFEGVVEDIGWYMTKIRTFERRPMYIPNALITDAIVENPGQMYNRRIKATIGLRYSDVAKVQPIADGIEAMLKEHSDIDQNQTLMVHFVEFGPYSLNLEIYTFTKTTNWAEYRKIQQDIFLRIAKIVEDHDASIAFPTNSIYLQNETGMISAPVVDSRKSK